MYSSKYSSTRTSGYELSPNVGWYKLGVTHDGQPVWLVYRNQHFVDVVQYLPRAIEMAHAIRKGEL